MDSMFSSDQMVYGDLDNDEELLEELYRLENEGKERPKKVHSQKPGLFFSLRVSLYCEF